MGKKPMIELSPETHRRLKLYCASKDKKISHIGDKFIRERLETEHQTLESEGEMTVEGEEKEKPKIKILKESEL